MIIMLLAHHFKVGINRSAITVYGHGMSIDHISAKGIYQQNETMLDKHYYIRDSTK